MGSPGLDKGATFSHLSCVSPTLKHSQHHQSQAEWRGGEKAKLGQVEQHVSHPRRTARRLGSLPSRPIPNGAILGNVRDADQLSRALLEALRRGVWIVSCSREALPQPLRSCTRPKRGCSWSGSLEECHGQGTGLSPPGVKGARISAGRGAMAVKIQET